MLAYGGTRDLRVARAHDEAFDTHEPTRSDYFRSFGKQKAVRQQLPDSLNQTNIKSERGRSHNRQICLRSRATGMPSISRYLATVRRAMR